jgi:membrane-associated protein
MIEALKYYLHLLYSFPELIRLGGYTALIAIVFIETGLMFGFFLPGDSLLVTAGLFAATGELNIYILLGSLSIAAIARDSVGYYIGHKTGKTLFKKEDNLFFKKKYLLKAQEFYDKHGGKTIVLARFVPIIRTFAPVVAGIGTMKYKRFLFFNVFGGILWVSSMTLLGYFLGKSIPNIEQNIHFVVLIVIFLSFLPIVWEYWKARSDSSKD